MDPATIAFAGALLVSVTGNMVQLALKRIGPPEAPKVEIPTAESISAIVRGIVAVHEVHCANVEKAVNPILARLQSIDDGLKQHINLHLEQRNGK